MASENAPFPLMSIVSGVTARIQGMKPATAPMTGAVDIAGPPTTVITNVPPLTLLAAPLRALSLSPIVTWALSVPLPWSEEMIPMRHASLLETMMETWKALPQTDRWNCQPRRGVMLHSARFVPLIFPNYPLRFPFIFPTFHPFIYQNPRTANLASLPPLKPYFLSHLSFFTLMTRSLDPVACIPGCTRICTIRLTGQ